MTTKEIAIKKALEQLVELKYITVNKLVNQQAVVMIITGAIEVEEREEKASLERTHLFELFDKHFPKQFEEFLEKLAKKDK
jgi:hypothetical protein